MPQHIFAQHPYTPGGGQHKTQQYADRRCFAGAVAAQERGYPGGMHLEADAIDCEDIVELFAQAIDFNYRVRHCRDYDCDMKLTLERTGSP